jgi:GTP-binding protein
MNQPITITSAVFVKSVTKNENLIRDEIPVVCFVGRSNVGKSSVINSLVGRKALVRSSSTPGFTKEANYFFEAFLAAAFFVAVLDLAGLVFPKLPANVFPFFVLMSPRPIL